MDERIVTRHIARSTWQGPESDAPDVPLPIDLPAIQDYEVQTPLQSVTRRDLAYIVMALICAFAGGALALWALQ